MPERGASLDAPLEGPTSGSVSPPAVKFPKPGARIFARLCYYHTEAHPAPAQGFGGPFLAVILSGCFEILWFFVTWFVSSMLSASFYKEALSRPFVFKMFSASYILATDGYNVIIWPVLVRLGGCCTIQSLLRRGRGGEASGPARSSAGVLTCQPNPSWDRPQSSPVKYNLSSFHCQEKLLSVGSQIV